MALDLIVCTDADKFAMTDSRSQISSLIAGYQINYGGEKCQQYSQKIADMYIFIKHSRVRGVWAKTKIGCETKQTSIFATTWKECIQISMVFNFYV